MLQNGVRDLLGGFRVGGELALDSAEELALADVLLDHRSHERELVTAKNCFLHLNLNDA